MKTYALLVELTQQKEPINYISKYANTYYVNATNIYAQIGTDWYGSLFSTFDSVFTDRIISVRTEKGLETELLETETTVANVIANKNTFYFDVSNKDLWIHFDNHKPPMYYDNIIIEAVIGFTSSNYEGQLLIDDTPYDKRVINLPQVKKKIDDELKPKQTFESFSVSIDNTDGRFSGWINDPFGTEQKKLRGNLVRYLAQASETKADLTDYSKYTLLQQGTIDSLTDGTQLTFNCVDIRKSINEPLANVALTGYADIKEGTTKPFIMGKKYGHEVVLMNPEATSGNLKYMICDTSNYKTIATDSIKAVYIDSNKQTGTPPTVLFDTTNEVAYFELAYFADNNDKLSIDVEGYIDHDGTITGTTDALIERGMHQIRYVLRETKGALYNARTYDTTQWSLYEDDTDYNFKTGWSVNEPKKTYEIIEQIANGSLFAVFEIDALRRYTWRVDTYVTTKTEILSTQILPEWFIGSKVKKTYSNILPFFWVEYQKRDDDFRQPKYYDNDFETSAFELYGITGGEDKTQFETLLVEEADVIKFAERVHEITDFPFITLAITVNDWNVGTATKAQELNAGDFIKVDLTDDGDLGYGKCIMKITEISPKTARPQTSDQDWTVAITGRIIKWASDEVISDDSGVVITEGGRPITISTAERNVT